MSLYVVATPIGHWGDFSERAKQTLRQCPVVIGEEWKPLRQTLKMAEASPPQTFILNEHSKKEDVKELLELCKTSDVALVSDCGTPAFSDPGSDLVHLCHSHGIPVRSVPGPSSLSTFISICGVRLDRFQFLGFLPARGDEREEELKKLSREQGAIILMDTPYRLQRLLEDLDKHLKNRRLVVGANLSTDEEFILTGPARQILGELKMDKAEFMLLVCPAKNR